MAKVLRLTVTTIGLLALLLMITGVAYAQPASGTWSVTGSMHIPRSGHTSTRLKNGKVLVVGGLDSSNHVLSSVELYDPTTGTWSFTGSLKVPRAFHTATSLPDGTVLVAGGVSGYYDGSSALASAELYNPATGMWSFTGSLNVGRENHSDMLLSNGQLLVAGGDSGTQDNPYIHALGSSELYNPATRTWSLTGSLNIARFDFPMLLLPNGKAMVAGGDDGKGFCCAVPSAGSTSHKAGSGSASPLSPCFCTHSTGTAELYDPGTGKWSLTARMKSGRVFHTLTSLPNSKVLAAAGEKCYNIFSGGCTALASSEVYDVAASTWTRVGDLQSTHVGHTATRLASNVLVAGCGSVSAELYNASTGAWSITGSMIVNHCGHRATRLASGQVLIDGGGTTETELYTP